MIHYKDQMSLQDYFSIGGQYTREGYHNVYDEMPDHDCEVDVIDRKGHRFKTRIFRNMFGNMVIDITKDRGYEICWWKEVI